ncbi:hypothetical protein E3P86_01976 [Wallemia ichthyophaga]|uniref:Uncharacterized protein n=1 Tax=Wallemia ichthyophaga TaxID=245174 RepID=A0A4T0J5E0_WALIC|nr:hypothetical protein E3P86_01976 [Wallemia ichthyophaga]
MSSNGKTEMAEEEIDYSSSASDSEHEANETLVSPNQTVEAAAEIVEDSQQGNPSQPTQPAKKNAPRKQRKKSAPGTFSDATNVINTTGQVVDTASKTVDVTQQPLDVLKEATSVAQPAVQAVQGVQGAVQTGKKNDKGNNPISLRLGETARRCVPQASRIGSRIAIAPHFQFFTSSSINTLSRSMSLEKGKQKENVDVSRIDRGLMESYAELGRQAIGPTHTDLTADKNGGPLKESRNVTQEEERDDALGLRLDLNLARLHGDVVLTLLTS